MGWKTAMQTEGDEQTLIYDVPVRKSPLVVPHPQYGVWTQAEFSGTQMPTPPERRLRPGLAAPQDNKWVRAYETGGGRSR